jgi:hypothetical protein
MHSPPDPIEPPEGLERRPTSALPEDADRPDWLVGADDALEGTSDSDSPRRPTLSEAPQAPAPLRVVEGKKPEKPKAWSGAASSIPRLTVVPATERGDGELEEDREESVERDSPSLLSERDDTTSASAPAPGPAFRPFDEPWYLVWAEKLVTDRRLQMAALGLIVATVAFFAWPRGGAQGTSLSGILSHPQRFEGHTVAVRGEVMEIFEVGQGFAFQLRQGRSMVVVYSTTREPRLHERVEVRGTVSTGYLDGTPRVAIFEGGAP